MATALPTHPTAGIYSVCSAHPLVLEAALLQAAEDGSLALIEATSNQVDQFGGYTGLRPADFRDLVHGIADRIGFDRERIVLGGDHLGPNRWQARAEADAMPLAEQLVEAYVEAGYTKIHLDCSMSLLGDPQPVGDALAASRAARLIEVAERVAAARGTQGSMRYVIGTEVPVPGGAHETLQELVPTTAADALATIEAHRQALAARGVADAWWRVAAVVVQPGVEFDHLRVVDYDPSRTGQLQAVLRQHPGLVFEAHSTDYQRGDLLGALVRDRWAILKVGPELTFALREAVFALAAIERNLVPEEERSQIVETIDRVMVERPEYWESYYDGDPDERRLARRFSYSDRLRYYWPDPAISAAEQVLFANLEARPIPLTLLSQYLPHQYWRIRAGTLGVRPRDLVVDGVRHVLRRYAAACRPSGDDTVTTSQPDEFRRDHGVDHV